MVAMRVLTSLSSVVTSERTFDMGTERREVVAAEAVVVRRRRDLRQTILVVCFVE